MRSVAVWEKGFQDKRKQRSVGSGCGAQEEQQGDLDGGKEQGGKGRKDKEIVRGRGLVKGGSKDGSMDMALTLRVRTRAQTGAAMCHICESSPAPASSGYEDTSVRVQ